MSNNEAFLATLKKLVNIPNISNMGRGTRGKEWLGNQVVLDMNYPFPTIQARQINYKLLAAGALWHIKGNNDVYYLQRYSKGIVNFYDGRYAYGAYGPKFRDQLPYVLESFNTDVCTRQAVINIWTNSPHVNNKDTSCLLSLQFIIRDWRLYTIVTMRSSDAWLGFPYDIFDYCMMSNYVLLCLRELGGDIFPNVCLGKMSFNSGSQHLYEKYFDKANDVLATLENHNQGPYLSNMFENPDHLEDWLQEMADSGGLNPDV